MKHESSSSRIERLRRRNKRRQLVKELRVIMLVVGLPACLLLLLAACDPAPRVKTLKMDPPAKYLKPTPIPEPEGQTVQYMIEEYVFELRGAVEAANADKAALREWAKEDP